MINSELLEKKIQESGLKKKYIAEQLGISLRSLHRKIGNESSFTIRQITILCKVLKITTLTEKDKIFLQKSVNESNAERRPPWQNEFR